MHAQLKYATSTMTGGWIQYFIFPMELGSGMAMHRTKNILIEPCVP